MSEEIVCDYCDGIDPKYHCKKCDYDICVDCVEEHIDDMHREEIIEKYFEVL